MAPKAKRRRPTLFGLGRRAARLAGREEGPPNPRAAQRRRTIRRGGRGRALGLVAAGSIAVLFAAPLAWSARAKPCEAAEMALVSGALGCNGGFGDAKRRLATWAAQDGRLLSRGRVAEQVASKEYPGWPSLAGCTAVFWRARATAALGW